MSPPRPVPCSTATGTKQQCWWVGGHREPKGAAAGNLGEKRAAEKGWLLPPPQLPSPAAPCARRGLINYAE